MTNSGTSSPAARVSARYITLTVEAYRKEDIAKVHEDVNDGSDTGEVAEVAADDEEDGEDVVCEHLVVVGPALFRVEHVELVEPPAELREVVELCQGWQRRCRVRSPERLC